MSQLMPYLSGFRVADVVACAKRMPGRDARQRRPGPAARSYAASRGHQGQDPHARPPPCGAREANHRSMRRKTQAIPTGLEAGTDPTLVQRWISSEVQAERTVAETRLRQLTNPPELGDMVSVLRNADPADNDLYRTLGRTLTYHLSRQVVSAKIEQNGSCTRLCRRSDTLSRPTLQSAKSSADASQRVGLGASPMWRAWVLLAAFTAVTSWSAGPDYSRTAASRSRLNC
jgi:hypothetical protein